MQQAVLYLRVSSKEQEEEGYSLDAQEKLAYEYARRKNLLIIKIWKVSESAWKQERKAFGQMVDFAARHPEVQHIIADTLDRMTRNDFDKLKIARLIREHGKTIHLSRSNRTMDRESGPDEEFLFDIEVAVAKKLSNDISRKVTMGMREKAEQGHFPSVAPVGYVNNPLTRKIEIDPERSKYVKKAFALMADDCSFGAISGILAHEGFRSRTGKIIGKSGIARILHDPVYHGDFLWIGKLYKGSHEAIVATELFDRAQAAMRRRRRRSNVKPPKRTFAFNGLMHCAVCGCKVIGEIKKDRFIYYHCTFSKGRHEGRGYFREHRIAEMFKEPFQLMQQTLELPKSLHDLYIASNYEQKAAILKLMASNYSLTDASIVPTYRKPLDMIVEGLHRT